MRRTRLIVPSILMLLGLLSPLGLGQTASLPASQPATQSAQQPVFRFGVIADTHIDRIETAENLRRFLFAMRDQKIDFLVILGDIVSYMPDLLEQVGQILTSSELKVHAIPGNKDNDYGKEPQWYRQALGESYYTFTHKGWRFVMYDSFNPPPTEWLKTQLAPSEPATPIVFCTHAPPEAKDLLGLGPWVELIRCPNVKAALAGHWHTRDTGHIGRLTYEVFQSCFLRGRLDPGSYYILDALPSGKIDIHEHSVSELNLRDPPDALPTVTISLPRAGQTLRSTTTFLGKAADDRDVQRVEYSLDWGPWQPTQGTWDWQVKFDTASLPDGNHLLRVRAIDSAGQASLRLPRAIITTENHLVPGRTFRFQQGRDGYSGCSDATVKRFARTVNHAPGDPSDLQCWIWKKGQEEFNEFYIRFDLAHARIPADAKIKRVSLTLHSPWQHSIDREGKLCGYFVGLLPEDFKNTVTFASRPAKPGWFGEPQPSPALTGTWPRLPWWYLSTLPQPVVIDLTAIKDKVQQWLRDPASNHGLVFSPAAGPSYNMSARGSRYPDVRYRPMLEIEIEPTAADK